MALGRHIWLYSLPRGRARVRPVSAVSKVALLRHKSGTNASRGSCGRPRPACPARRPLLFLDGSRLMAIARGSIVRTGFGVPEASSLRLVLHGRESGALLRERLCLWLEELGVAGDVV